LRGRAHSYRMLKKYNFFFYQSLATVLSTLKVTSSNLVAGEVKSERN
jgi:hypothetical protein